MDLWLSWEQMQGPAFPIHAAYVEMYQGAPRPFGAETSLLTS